MKPDLAKSIRRWPLAGMLAVLLSVSLPAAGCAATATPGSSRLPPPPQDGAVLAQQQADTRPVLRVTKEQASQRANAFQAGQVTSVDLERKRGRVVWVVEIQTQAGDEVDVMVDVESGEVLGLDTDEE